MTESINILILSCGSRNKIIQYFKKELTDKGQVIAADCSHLAPALYEADNYFIVPRIDDENYLDTILDICKQQNIKGVLSLLDPELLFLSKNKDAFLEIGTIPIVSDYDIIELCFNKYEFSNYLNENNFKSKHTYIDKDLFYKDVEAGLIAYPVFVKPITGSASININKATSEDQVEYLFKKTNNLMIQENMDGIEYGIDAYIDLISAKPVAIFAKEKIKMRAGETDKSVSVKDEKIFNLVKQISEQTNFKGMIDIDLFKIEDEYYILEVNPRFGGGFPHAYECGVNVPAMIIKNLTGEENESVIGQYEEDVYMMKFNAIKIIK